MPNSIITNDTRPKQPTGSSKRKRRYSIKRNILKDDDSDYKGVIKSPKIEKTYPTKFRNIKTKLVSETSVSNKKSDEVHHLRIRKNEIGPKEVNEEADKKEENEEEKNEKVKCKASDSSVSKCKLQQECQNCDVCSEDQDTKDNSDELHKRTKKRFPCEVCADDGSSKVYCTIEKLNQHRAVAHNIYSGDIKKFKCPDCPTTVWFPSKSKLAYHLGTKHPGVVKFICDVCTETFKLKTNYKVHIKTHNIVVKKKFTCDVCNGTFVNKAGFEAHQKRFPGPHIKQNCAHCGFSFSREKHLLNHRCKTLLLEEAAAKSSIANSNKINTTKEVQLTKVKEEVKELPKVIKQELSPASSKRKSTRVPVIRKAPPEGSVTENDSLQKSTTESDTQSNTTVVLHTVIPRNQDQTLYSTVPMPLQTIPESVLVQEVREIDFDGGTFIAAPTNSNEPQFIVRDINGHLVQGNQILQFDINDVQAGEEPQVYLTDWNIVAPYIIQEKSP